MSKQRNALSCKKISVTFIAELALTAQQQEAGEKKSAAQSAAANLRYKQGIMANNGDERQKMSKNVGNVLCS